MPGPLHGYRVVDLTSNVAGPLGTMILGDQGADVIKVEAPDGGDATRAGGNRRAGFTASFLNNNRNKRSIVLDLKTEAGLRAFMRLVAGASGSARTRFARSRPRSSMSRSAALAKGDPMRQNPPTIR
jgi:crotonobetainyl-CoA:carnitine CoA-transferase CaiB-like acyl-CoA transferase